MFFSGFTQHTHTHHTHTHRTRKEDTFYRHKDTGETKWFMVDDEINENKDEDKNEEEENKSIADSTKDPFKELTSKESESDRKNLVSSEATTQSLEIEKRVFTRLELVLLQHTDDYDDDDDDGNIIKTIASYLGPHISADTRQLVGHLLGLLGGEDDDKISQVVLNVVDIETLWNQYEQFVKETDALYSQDIIENFDYEESTVRTFSRLVASCTLCKTDDHRAKPSDDLVRAMASLMTEMRDEKTLEIIVTTLCVLNACFRGFPDTKHNLVLRACIDFDSYVLCVCVCVFLSFSLSLSLSLSHTHTLTHAHTHAKSTC